MPKIIQGRFDATGMRVALVSSRFNAFIVDHLESGAVDALVRHGAKDEDIDLVRVSGAYELPLVVDKVARTGNYDAVIALGCLIRGGTAHYELIASEVTKGIAQVSIASGVPVAFGVLTCDTLEQAIERAGTKAGNKGVEAALAAIETVSLLRDVTG